jgi:hypothetical protein
MLLAGALLTAGAVEAKVQVDFIPVSAEHRSAAQVYEWIWSQYGERIVDSLETRTCLPFSEPRVSALVAEAVSHSGGPAHPMRLRASYFHNGKRSTLVHELGHRHLWQLSERLEDVDGHMTLYLVLDRVWADVWGEEFADDRVRFESTWRATYDYGSAWAWARSLTPQERSRLWNELLVMNGFPGGCDGLLDGGPSSSTSRPS